MSKNSKKKSRERSKAKRSAKNIGKALREQARSKYAAMMKKLHNPTYGEKPPDPEPVTNTAPGSGVDDWREQK